MLQTDPVSLISYTKEHKFNSQIRSEILKTQEYVH